MFNFLQTDNKPHIEITGVSIQSCEYSCKIRDDLRLLLSLGKSAYEASNQILNYYLPYLKNILDEYDYNYYYPLTYISIAYYLAKNGYYVKEIFDYAILYIDGEDTMFPWLDAIKYESKGVNPWQNVLIDTFGEKAKEVAEEISGEIIDEISFVKFDVPKIICDILILDKKAKTKAQNRRNELLKIKKLLQSHETFKVKKPTASSVIYNIKQYRFSSEFEEGDVVSYLIKTGKNAGKYAIFTVDYIRELRLLLCDYDNFVIKTEHFALFDGLFNEIPQNPPKVYRVLDVFYDQNNDEYPINHFVLDGSEKEFNSLNLTKIGYTQKPNLKRSFISQDIFKQSERESSIYINAKDLDELLNNLF